ncbi:hypothetical protein VTK73DRAFT_4902 [Phialemonium thermophilum]|uniref:AAA+ ATPase domain-containing protein n=1 Tax=Phialemonium thermophilum TaxID=223376 RepID=A0ABR3WR20_9PEZI
MKTLDLKIRATNPGSEQNLKFASRVYISRDALIELTNGVEDGKPITVQRFNEDGQVEPICREATLWTAPTKLVRVAQMSEVFRSVCGYSIGDQVRISYSPGSAVADADEVVVEDVTPGNAAGTPPLQSVSDRSFWEHLVARHLVHIDHVFAGLTLKKLQVPPPAPVFRVSSVNRSTTALARFVPGQTVVRIAHGDRPAVNGDEQRELAIQDVPGRETQVKELNKFLRRFMRNSAFNRPDLLVAGLVIHGTHGTGKTMLLDRIASLGWGTVHRIQYKDKLSDIQETLAKARNQQPSIVLIDMLERLIDKERNNRNAVILALCDAFDGLIEDARAKGQLPRVVVVATCMDYATDIPADLRDPGRFTRDIYLPLPDVPCRKAILSSYDLPLPPDRKEETLRSLSERTHAYNAKDLQRLVDEAIDIAEDLIDQQSVQDVPSETEDTERRHLLPPEVFDQALRRVRPSAMHDINLKPPPVRWDDIGGQDSVKIALRQAVTLSTAPKELLATVIERPPRGFLLYGPPGCSKTMAAQAMATESGLNFFAVKGAELLNMYVGESERAVRRLFERAREAAPSMIFFDEIDAIAGQRHGFGHSGTSSGRSGAGSSHGGLNVLTTLLNEMDGFETTEGVLVLAATNRPQALDPALLRPGRFDDLIYVSPPDRRAREAIFRGVAARRRLLLGNDIDAAIAYLADATDGYSGAEIKGICAAAGRAAWARYSAAVSLTPTAHGGDGGAGVELGISMADLEAAIANQKRQITEEMLRGYAEWEKQFRKY